MVKKRGKNSKSRNKKGNSRLYLANKNNLIPKSKRSQEIFGLSFGMIFAVILIIFFVFMAFIVIGQFIDTRDCAKIGIFYNELNKKVKDAWDSGDITSRYTIDLPSQVDAVCFANLTESFIGVNKTIGDEMATYNTEDNAFLYATKKTSCDLTSYYIEHLDLDKIIRSENPFCIKLTHGRGAIVVDMQNGEKYVSIGRE